MEISEMNLAILSNYNAHMGFADKSDRMVNSYGTARRTWKWTKNYFSTFQTGPFSMPTYCTSHVAGK
jgi:hypothetical protein